MEALLAVWAAVLQLTTLSRKTPRNKSLIKDLFKLTHYRKFSWFDKDQFTDDMLRKVEEKGIKSVTDFRIVKQYINNAVKSKKISAISKRLAEFAAHPSLTPDHLNIESAKVAAEAKKLLRSAENLYAQINAIDVDEYYGEEAMWTRLESLAHLIREKLRALGRREAE